MQRARSNVAQELNSDEFFNGPYLDAYGWNNVNGVPKWNWVTSANYRAPYGFILSGLLTLNSGPAFGNIMAPWNSPTGDGPAAPAAIAQHGRRVLARRRISHTSGSTFALRRPSRLPWGHELTADFEVFNAFNWLNRNYSSWGAGGGEPAADRGQPGRRTTRARSRLDCATSSKLKRAAGLRPRRLSLIAGAGEGRET